MRPAHHTAPERDPPTSLLIGGQSYDAVGPWPKGSLARPEASAIYVHTSTTMLRRKPPRRVRRLPELGESGLWEE